MTLRIGLAVATLLTVGILALGRPVPASACPSGARSAMIVHRGSGLRPPGQSTAVPLVIGLHASQSNPWGLEHISGLDRVADQNGFVVAYLGSQTPTASAWALCNMSSNLAYISSAISQLTASENIDPSRVYVTGFSAGATMTFRAGCALSTKVAGIAPVSGWMTNGQACPLKRPVSMMLFIGTNDAINVNGTSRLMSGYGMGAFWAGLDGCASPAATTPGVVTFYNWNRCAQTSAVAVNVIAGGTHNWPPAGSGGDRLVDASRMMWSFFSAHPPASTALGVRLSAARVGHAGSLRWVRISITANMAPIVLKAVLGSHGRRIAQQTFHLSHTRPVVLGVPKIAPAGRVRLTLTISDRYGRRRTIVRAVNLA